MEVINTTIEVNDQCWLYFPINTIGTLGEEHELAKVHCRGNGGAVSKEEDGKSYLKVTIAQILWHGPTSSIRFIYDFVTKSGVRYYLGFTEDVNRLILIEEDE